MYKSGANLHETLSGYMVQYFFLDGMTDEPTDYIFTQLVYSTRYCVTKFPKKTKLDCVCST